MVSLERWRALLGIGQCEEALLWRPGCIGGGLRILSDDVSGSCIGSGSRGVTEDVCVVRVSHAAAAVGSGIAFLGFAGVSGGPVRGRAPVYGGV